MVIGNGFFSPSEHEAVEEMRSRSGCEVRRCVFPTIGNIVYYVSTKGDLYGVQKIQCRVLTRTSKLVRNKGGFTARMRGGMKREEWLPLQLLTYCTFVLGRWDADAQLEFKNGDPFDCRPENLRPKRHDVPPEWAACMATRADVYANNFAHVCWSVNYTTGYDIDTCKDFVQNAFIYLCTDGRYRAQHSTDIVGLWVKIARFRAIDYMKHVTHRQVYDVIDGLCRRDASYEFDLFSLLPGKKAQLYTRLYFEGNTPTEIAKEYNVLLGSVSSAVTRSVQYLREYLKDEIPQWK